ncbi:MAG TPA: galactokinase family protein [Bryobacteraceae bacterium]|nr:galactokinase family protein [Bryobacteraceae bacterium]
MSEPRPMFVCRAPGRLDLIGGNGDYVGGLVFEATIREATWAAVRLRDDRTIVFINPQMSEKAWLDRVEFNLDELTDEAAVRALVNRDPRSRWTAYVLGIFFLLRERHPKNVHQGCDVYIESEVPLNKGVSSSAAVEVAVMKAAAAAYGVPMQGVELAENCQWVENVIAESACGIMDQMTSVLGDEGHVLPLLCQPATPLPLVKLPDALTCWAIDSGVSHQVTGIEYEAARAAAFMGYKLICDWEGLEVRHDASSQIPRFVDDRWNGYLANLAPSEFRSRYESRLPERMTGDEYMLNGQVHVDPFTQMRPEVSYRVRACTRYSVEENYRVRTFAELARGGTGFEEMGELLYQAHWSYTECGLGCKETDQIVELVREEGPENGLFGAKITGGGAGGTVAVLGYKTARRAFDRVVASYADLRGGEMPYVFEGSSMGADRFGVQVVCP